ncbi:cytidylate kinase [Pilibacter termitis]|uniref:Cytidylate kinase n=1 Tax=Pilibacter termitis TaxID=263852 RepID=A0A1T4N4J6_9ENTE|nr:(d)CMP kinase [Pilibacter termitis]SJZ74229.1 cytidylate kinase [Pilibacter termitis]
MKDISIAIDGPASSGKSTVAKILAKDYGYIYIDTGAMYRAVTYLALAKKISVETEELLIQAIEKQPISFQASENGQQVFVGDENVTEAIRQNDVTNLVSTVAAKSLVRTALVKLQQEFGKNGGVVMDGRDIGTVVLPKAEVKIFLVASVEERAERRYKENIAKKIPTDFEILKEEIARRDYLDSTREISPLVQAEDAVLLDTTGLNIEEVVGEIKKIIIEKTR